MEAKDVNKIVVEMGWKLSNNGGRRQAVLMLQVLSGNMPSQREYLNTFGVLCEAMKICHKKYMVGIFNFKSRTEMVFAG